MSNATNNRQGNDSKRAAQPPAFDPERPMLVQPWREFEGRGWLEVQYLGGSITRTVRIKLLHPALLKAEDVKTDGHTFVGPQEAKDRVVSASLWTPAKKGGKGQGKAQVEQLPKRSITKKDFEGNDESLKSRARSVANNLGERTAAGRIGSMELTRKGKATFSQWWDGAGGDRKARLLSDKKHYDSLSTEDKSRLNAVLSDCPFRANDAVPVKEEESAEAATSAPKQSTTEKKAEKKEGKGKKQPASG